MPPKTPQSLPGHSPTSAPPLISVEVQQTLHAVEERQMGAPALLFFAGHRPLSFVLGQLLYAAAPLVAMAGWTGCGDWAAILSDPAGPAALEDTLQHGIE